MENALGRLWLLNRPNSKLVEQMDYYIKPEKAEVDFLHINKPEEIKICDPACGSGHMLTYAFDLLYAIYEEEGVDPAEIPEKILTNNLYGIEIDERAGELAAFALTMKARAKQRRFFNKGIKPNICVLENVQFDESELQDYMDFVGRDLFTAPLQKTLRQFEEAKNFGSLIRPDVTDVASVFKILESKNLSEHLFFNTTHHKVLQALRQADYLNQKYHVVIANPPYMGGNGMNVRLGSWLKENYENVKSDLFSAFIVRNTELTLAKGQLGFMSPFVWMFISSYEKLRNFLINQKTITSLVQLEYSGFDGATVPICTFTVENSYNPDFKGGYVKLSDFRGSEIQGDRTIEAIKTPNCSWFYRATTSDFKKIPGNPIAYWVSANIRNSFATLPSLGGIATTRKGMVTGDNSRFTKFWYEVEWRKIGFDYLSRQDAQISGMKWFPYIKGGGFRKWIGNVVDVVLWENDGEMLRNIKHPTANRPLASNFNLDYVFKPNVSWGAVTSSEFSARLSLGCELFDQAGNACFPAKDYLNHVLCFLNSKVAATFLKALNSTLNFVPGDIADLPFNQDVSSDQIRCLAEDITKLGKSDWDAYELSWGFKGFPLLISDCRQPTLNYSYQKLRAYWNEITQKMRRLEQENNRIFLEAYCLQDELTPEVPLNEITLTCNPHYRYGNDKSEEEKESLLLADTMRELVSYAVGCMFGRYALDKPGLILANQGDNIEKYLKRVSEPIFPADDDNVIPILDGDWFTDDIVERFRKFLRIAFGEEHYEANLEFVEQGLNIKGKRNYSIRDYFLGEFYNDHVKRYKKRPIYWLFSSPKGTFNALIYMHRYRPDTVSVVLNDYLREFRTKLNSHKNHLEAVSINASASQSEKTKALKEIEKITKMISEMEDYEHEVLYPLATEQVEIDLDDGVKVNYPKFGAALKKIVGLDEKEE